MNNIKKKYTVRNGEDLIDFFKLHYYNLTEVNYKDCIYGLFGMYPIDMPTTLEDAIALIEKHKDSLNKPLENRVIFFQ